MFEFMQYILTLIAGGLLIYVRYLKKVKETEIPESLKYFGYWLVFAALITMVAQYHLLNVN